MSNKEDRKIQHNSKKSGIAIISSIAVMSAFIIFAGLNMWTCKNISMPWQKTADSGSYKFGDVSVSVNQNVWPTDAPNIVPTFSAGKIEASGRLGDVWTVTITGANDNDYNKYKETLKNAGWTIDSSAEIDFGDMKSFTANKDGYIVNGILSVDEQKNKNILISISKEVQSNN